MRIMFIDKGSGMGIAHVTQRLFDIRVDLISAERFSPVVIYKVVLCSSLV
jgi:hypothetical protein